MHFSTRLKPTSHLLDMTPLVDIVFLLLIFFIVTSDTLPLKSLPVTLPTLPTDTPPLTAQLSIVVDAHEVIYVGSKKKIVELSTLTHYLEREIDRYRHHHSGTTPTVALQIDGSVPYATFLQVFHAAQLTGATLRLAYHTTDDRVDDHAPPQR